MCPYDEGREAYYEGLDIENCPYTEADADAAEWCAGWASADDDAEDC